MLARRAHRGGNQRYVAKGEEMEETWSGLPKAVAIGLLTVG